ncbi:hypothetical protein [Fluviispira multicolorata]|uniref:Uncharacterized protein n=1 Tax=Fluviispira multicolorata TaxID=2654512 RepID=A0A833JI12_9BACT|nr:hypothetical protein [Fluviispira multicolorata]KAB8033647.1 hypothetical protein GCL57_02765 [Fluviispira multicolorata]
MSFCEIVKADFLQYDEPDLGQGFVTLYIHDFKRIIPAFFLCSEPPSNLFCINLGYKKNEEIFLEFETFPHSKTIWLQDNVSEKIITSSYSNRMHVIGTFLGFCLDEENNTRYAKIKANDFFFLKYVDDYQNEVYTKGNKLYLQYMVNISFTEERVDIVSKMYKELNPTYEESDGWPSDPRFWVGTSFNPKDENNPLEEMIKADPEKVRRLLGRENEPHYKLKKEHRSYAEHNLLEENDVKSIMKFAKKIKE